MKGFPHYDYSWEEFWEHVQAMKNVRGWEESVIFGHLGPDQTSRNNSARVIEFFHDNYSDQKEFGMKSMHFMAIHDYMGEHREFFRKKGLLEEREPAGMIEADVSLFRAIHYVFTSTTIAVEPRSVAPSVVVMLARAFEVADKGENPRWPFRLA